MFENIVGFFKKLFKKETEEENNKDMAKERLHLVLMQDRANVSADFLDMMKQEIIDVIKKYIDVDESEIDVHLTNKTSDDGTTGPALYANIPIVSIKHSGDIDDETKERVKEQKIEKDEKEEVVVDSQEKTEKEDNEEKIEEKVENKDEKENKEVAKKVNKSNNKKEKNNKDKEKSADDTITEKKDAIIADDKENEEKVELKVEEMDVTDEGEVLNQKEEKTEKKQKKKVEKKEEVKRDNKKTSNKKRK